MMSIILGAALAVSVGGLYLSALIMLGMEIVEHYQSRRFGDFFLFLAIFIALLSLMLYAGVCVLPSAV